MYGAPLATKDARKKECKSLLYEFMPWGRKCQGNYSAPRGVYGRAEEKKLTFLATYDVRGSSYGCIAATLSPCMPDT